MGLPLAGTHQPGRTHHFYWNLRRIRHIYWADRVVVPYRKPCKFTLDKYPIRVYSEDTLMGYLNIKRRLAYAGTQAMFLL